MNCSVYSGHGCGVGDVDVAVAHLSTCRLTEDRQPKYSKIGDSVALS